MVIATLTLCEKLLADYKPELDLDSPIGIKNPFAPLDRQIRDAFEYDMSSDEVRPLGLIFLVNETYFEMVRRIQATASPAEKLDSAQYLRGWILDQVDDSKIATVTKLVEGYGFREAIRRFDGNILGFCVLYTLVYQGDVKMFMKRRLETKLPAVLLNVILEGM